MMATGRNNHIQPDYGYGRAPAPVGILDSRSSLYPDVSRAGFNAPFYPTSSATRTETYSNGYSSGSISNTTPSMSAGSRPESLYSTSGFNIRPSSVIYGAVGQSYGSIGSSSSPWDAPNRSSPEAYMDDFVTPPSPPDHVPVKVKSNAGNEHPQRRPSNRDEFDGPHQFLQPLSPEYIAQQERDLPHLPTNLVVQEQDSVLSQVNDRLSQCAFDFVAKYQFPIPVSSSMRPVERPQDREWTEWVYLLKRLATKRRIPARVLYNGQIKQFVTILENSLEMRHAAKHQSRPLKDDRNVLQLISAGIQVARILRDASAMDNLDQLYIATERKIQERSNARFRS